LYPNGSPSRFLSLEVKGLRLPLDILTGELSSRRFAKLVRVLLAAR
jgi:hypothetical protein